MDFDGEETAGEDFLDSQNAIFLDNSPYSLIAEAENVVESYDKPSQANSPSGRALRESEFLSLVPVSSDGPLMIRTVTWLQAVRLMGKVSITVRA
ncbi:hypothetical protein B1F79_00130 [Coxiella-like endosymbiont of Rhipicephalus sanguineus]|uniref:hypothetical protein n=1 Tax=Coxiella-like endosymbiont of Rhipicephalus sanguineus TaxID=1955402 RepID=UPI00203E95C0|nr:hypothetical protein [Coxiella-like endosymbiont of Rhipicephalus sanguineus]MBT8506211.1 hypothetical protein [Coxiella-like endosymbiont of Rhipicephalus sanguineus]